MSSSTKEKLEKLHGSRKRARERAEEENASEGVYTAADAVERAHPPGESPEPDADDAPDDAPPAERNVEHDSSADSVTTREDPTSTSDEPSATRDDQQLETRRDDGPGHAQNGRRHGKEARRSVQNAPSSAQNTPRDAQDPPPQDPEPQSDGSYEPQTEVGEKLSRSYSLREKSSLQARSGSRDSGRENRGGERSRPDVSRETERPQRQSDASDRRETGGASRRPPNERASELRKRAERLLAGDDWEAALPILHEIVAILPRHPFGLEKLAEYHRGRGEYQLQKHYESRLRDVTPW